MYMKQVCSLVIVLLCCGVYSGGLLAVETPRATQLVAASLDINSATAAELAQALPGIGPAKAQRIVQWRTQNGRFESVDQLIQVKGIGPKTLSAIKQYLQGHDDAHTTHRSQPVTETLQEQQTRLAVRRIVRQVESLGEQTQAPAHGGERSRHSQHASYRPWYRQSLGEIMRSH